MNDHPSDQTDQPVAADAFQEGQAFEVPSEHSGAAFVVDLEGFEGPIDVLLSLARDHKLDITQISMVALADQYLAFVAEARRQNLELAADYLVMAAWLAYMKSRLLLPDLDGEDEPTGEEMAAALAFQLKRLQSMQDAGEKLMARNQLGIDFFRRGAPEVFRRTFNTVWDASLFDLLKAYGDQHRRRESGGPLHIEPFEMYTMEDALLRLRRLLGPVPEWRSLWAFLPEDLRNSLKLRSAVAATFAASLEMAREGYLKLQQSGTFGPIHIRPSRPSGQPANDDEAGNAQ
ncbi:MAG: ScpA family protein [Rhodospirillaceae bacterium]